MSRKQLFSRVYEEQIIGVVREDDPAVAEQVALAYAQNGIHIVEVTLTTPDAFELMASLAKQFGEQIILAAGTVRSSNDAAAARRAGAQLIVSPHTDVRVIEYANDNDMLSIAGAATPTEILTAWNSGCDIVKIYPAHFLGGPDYVKTIRGPIRDVPMLAGGPVPLDMIEPYLDAGCVAVNLGPSLAVPDLVRNADWDEIGRRAVLATSIIQSRREASEETQYVH